MARGRPRKFDETKALTGAMHLFWEKGLSATSLDDLAIAMDMRRPSIYNAFGNKEDIYRKSLMLFCGQLDRALEETLESSFSIREGLIAFFNQAIEAYCGNNPPMGCLMICTAPSVSLSHPEVGRDLVGLIQRLDKGFTKRLERAEGEGEIAGDQKLVLTAKMLQAILQTLAIRARTGESSSALRKLARFGVENLIR
jgi:AcrR family transcriptional regulator